MSKRKNPKKQLKNEQINLKQKGEPTSQEMEEDKKVKLAENPEKGETNTPAEDKLQKKYPFLFFFLKNATSFGAIFAITVGIFPWLMGYFNQIMTEGYCEYLGLNNIPLNVEVSSYWSNLIVGLSVCFIIFIEAIIMYKFKNKLVYKVIFFPCVFMEITLLFIICTLIFYGNTGTIEIIQLIIKPIVIFLIMILCYFRYIVFIAQKNIVIRSCCTIAIIIGMTVWFIYSLKQIEAQGWLSISFIISYIIYIPYFVDGLDRLGYLNKGKKVTQKKEVNQDNQDEEEKKEDVDNKMQIKTFLYLVSSILIIFAMTCYFIYSMSSLLDNFYNKGIDILLDEEIHHIIEENQENKYLLLENKNNEKIIMKIIDTKMIKSDDEESEIKTYFVEKGEFAYLTDYNKVPIKTEKCKIDVKENERVKK